MATKKRTVTLIASEDKNPKVELKSGMKFEVVAVKLIQPKGIKPPKLGARLCGGGGTCLALIDVDPSDEVSNKSK